jgi:ArsR family transcriptional regulator
VTASYAETALAAPAPPALLAVLAEPLRWRIVQLLAAEELCTTHLRDALGAGQPLVSHHLRVLREAGVVLTEPCGRYTYYRLSPGALDGLSAELAVLARASTAPVRRRSC